MIVFQVSNKFDPEKEMLKIGCQIYILMKKVIILRKKQAKMTTFIQPFLNHFSWTQPAITCSKLTTETLEQGVKHVQS